MLDRLEMTSNLEYFVRVFVNLANFSDFINFSINNDGFQIIIGFFFIFKTLVLIIFF